MIDVKKVPKEEMIKVMKRELDKISEEDYVEFVIGFQKFQGEEEFTRFVGLTIDKKVRGE